MLASRQRRVISLAALAVVADLPQPIPHQRREGVSMHGHRADQTLVNQG
jgi:hypothetical protein